MKLNRLVWLGILSCSVCGCFSIKNQSEISAPQTPSPSLSQTNPDTKKITRKPELPQTLGGIISSDRWVVYQDKSEEEFEGHVSYDNGTYIFRADYALSKRLQNQVLARGHVYLRKNETDGSWAELYAQQVQYNYQTGQGKAWGNSNTPLHLIYQTAQGELFHAWGNQVVFNTKEQSFQLTKHAKITRQDVEGQITTLTADHISAHQPGPYVLLQGNARFANEQYHLQAQTLEYDGQHHQAYAYGERPLTQGTTESGTFAIIADKVTAQTLSRRLQLEGQVQGWIVSEQINQADKGKK